MTDTPFARTSAADVPCLADEPVRVRLLEAHDLASVVRIDAASMGRRREEYYAAKVRSALEDSRLSTSLVAEVDDHVVGFVLSRVHYGEFGCAEPVAVIDSIGVDPAYRKRGVGRALLGQLLGNLRALGIERLETQVDWLQIELLGFLASEGFSPAPRLCLERRLG